MSSPVRYGSTAPSSSKSINRSASTDTLETSAAATASIDTVPLFWLAPPAMDPTNTVSLVETTAHAIESTGTQENVSLLRVAASAAHSDQKEQLITSISQKIKQFESHLSRSELRSGKRDDSSLGELLLSSVRDQRSSAILASVMVRQTLPRPRTPKHLLGKLQVHELHVMESILDIYKLSDDQELNLMNSIKMNEIGYTLYFNTVLAIFIPHELVTKLIIRAPLVTMSVPKTEREELITAIFNMLDSKFSIESLNLGDKPITDDELYTILSHLKGLKILNLDSCWLLTGRGFAFLIHSPNLKSLNLSYTKIKDAELDAILRHLNGLEILVLQFCVGLTDRAFTNIGGCTHLKSLDLSGTRVTNAVLVHLKPLINLKHLSLDLANLTDAGLSFLLTNFPNLISLSVRSNNLTDAGLNVQGDFPNLESLDLGDNNGITNAGLVHIIHFPNLKILQLHKTSVTNTGISSLIQQLPGVSILNSGKFYT